MEDIGFIKVRTADDRGRRRKRYFYFPVNDLALLISELIDRPTIRNFQLKALKKLGYKIVYVGRKDDFLDKLGATYEEELFAR